MTVKPNPKLILGYLSETTDASLEEDFLLTQYGPFIHDRVSEKDYSQITRLTS